VERHGLTLEVGIDGTGQIWDQPVACWTPQPWKLGGGGPTCRPFGHLNLGRKGAKLPEAALTKHFYGGDWN
jgi:hypothetical protein